MANKFHLISESTYQKVEEALASSLELLRMQNSRFTCEADHDLGMSDGEVKVKGQSTSIEQMATVTIDWKIWKALLKIAGRQINPETAKVCKLAVQITDPYGVHPDTDDCVGRLCFASDPDSPVWVLFDDLPEATRIAL